MNKLVVEARHCDRMLLPINWNVRYHTCCDHMGSNGTVAHRTEAAVLDTAVVEPQSYAMHQTQRSWCTGLHRTCRTLLPL